MKNALTMYVEADRDLDAATDAPARYAEALTALVADGWAERVTMPTSGRPTAAETGARKPLTDALNTRGGSAAAKRQRVLRAIYAVHILAANPRREDESDEAYVARCLKVRAIATEGNRDQVDKAIKGAAKGTARTSKGRKTGTPNKAPKTPETPETPKPADTGEAVTATYEDFRKSSIAMRDAIDEHTKGGGKVTKAMRSQIAASLDATREILEALAS